MTLTIDERLHKLEIAHGDLSQRVRTLQLRIIPKLEERIEKLIGKLVEKIEKKNNENS